MDPWLSQARDRIASASGLASPDLDLTDSEVATLLSLARIAAHESGKRTNAPLLCYLLGRASRETELERLVEALDEE